MQFLNEKLKTECSILKLNSIKLFWCIIQKCGTNPHSDENENLIITVGIFIFIQRWPLKQSLINYFHRIFLGNNSLLVINFVVALFKILTISKCRGRTFRWKCKFDNSSWQFYYHSVVTCEVDDWWVTGL